MARCGATKRRDSVRGAKDADGATVRTTVRCVLPPGHPAPHVNGFVGGSVKNGKTVFDGASFTWA
ncbi:MAG: hypothetical protein AAB368_13290 [bacterium]